MAKQKRAWDMISDGRRQTCLRDIIVFFQESRDETIGMIAAEEVLDLVLQLTSGDIYIKGVNDSKKVLEDGLGDLQLNLDMLIG
jgi:uncharacterized protein (DUF2164 family)